MQNICIKNTNTKELLTEISNSFNASFLEKEGGCLCSINNSKGSIEFIGIDFELGLSVLRCEGSFTETTEISLKKKDANIIQFVGVLVGNTTFSQGGEVTKLKYDDNQSIVIYNKYASVKKYTFTKDITSKVLIISLDISKFIMPENDKVNLNLLNLIDWLNGLQLSNSNLYIGKNNEEMDSLLQAFFNLNLDNCNTILNYFESLICNTLINQITFFHSHEVKYESKALLKTDKLTKLIALIAVIKENPQEIYTIRMLCEKTGLSPLKLQEGFKVLCGRTVIDFIRHVRLNTAERFIRTSDMTIAEVIYAVGFTSRSYFSKIFKNKYGYSPKQYQIKRKVAS